MLGAEGKKINAAFEFAIDDDLLVRRIAGRLTHKASGRTYHVEFAPPKGVCVCVCVSALSQRSLQCRARMT